MNVSLIIPTLNQEKTIRLCLDSLYKQLSRGDEVLLVDSYSSDNTLNIAKEYDVKVIKTRGNRSVARNIGWKKAKNEIIIFIESDSVYSKDYVKNVKKIMGDKSANALLDKREHYNPNNWVSKTLNKEFLMRYANNFVPATAWIYRKEALKDVKGFDESLEYGEDADIGLRLKKKGYDILFKNSIIQYHLGEPNSLKAVIIRAWKFGKNMKLFYKKNNNTPWAKIALFAFSALCPLLLVFIFLINVIRYNYLNLFEAVKLAVLNLLRNIIFSISYLVNLI